MHNDRLASAELLGHRLRLRCQLGFLDALVQRQRLPDYLIHVVVLVGAEAADEGHAGPRITEYSEAIRAAGGDVSIFEYPDSVHAFFNDDRPEVYQAENAAQAWQRSVEFLAARLR